MLESCTLYHSIGLLAYRDDEVARRYGAKPGVRESGRVRRKRDNSYPTASGLPGTDVFNDAKGEEQHDRLMQQWKSTDKARWAEAKALLWRAVQADRVPAFGTAGKVDQEFWLTHDLDSREAQFFRFRRGDLNELLFDLGPPNMEFAGGYISPFFITNHERATAELTDPLILIHEKTLSCMGSLLPLLEHISQSRQSLLVVAGNVEGGLLQALVGNKRKGLLKLAAVRVPGPGERLKAVLEDIATVTGGLVINENLGIELSEVTLDMLGTAKKIVVEKGKTTIFEGGGKKIVPDDAAPLADDLDEPQRIRWPGRGQAAALISDRTGAQGRPTSRHLVVAEFQHRIDTGAVLDTLKREAEALSNWLTANHTGLAVMTRKTVESCIRSHYNRWKASK